MQRLLFTLWVCALAGTALSQQLGNQTKSRNVCMLKDFCADYTKFFEGGSKEIASHEYCQKLDNACSNLDGMRTGMRLCHRFAEVTDCELGLANGQDANGCDGQLQLSEMEKMCSWTKPGYHIDDDPVATCSLSHFCGGMEKALEYISKGGYKDVSLNGYDYCEELGKPCAVQQNMRTGKRLCGLYVLYADCSMAMSNCNGKIEPDELRTICKDYTPLPQELASKPWDKAKHRKQKGSETNQKVQLDASDA